MFNIGGCKTPTPLEQFIMEYVWAHPNCTAEECREGLASRRRLKDSTIRTILRKLEEKGYASQLQRLAEKIASRREKKA